MAIPSVKKIRKCNFRLKLIPFVLLSLSLVAVVSSDNCSLSGYDLVPLTKAYWSVAAEAGTCPNANVTCTYLFSLCLDGAAAHGAANLALCPAGNEACVHDSGGANTGLGQHPVLVGQENAFTVVYVGTSDSKQFTTTLRFICDPQRPLLTGNDTLVGILHAESVHKAKENVFEVNVKYAGACKNQPPPPTPPTPTPPPPAPSGGGMGPGGQLFVCLLVMALLYFGGGVIYNHVNGARGIELLPHHWFWTNFPSYVVDGCLYLVRVVTCQPRPTYQNNADYGSTSPGGLSPSGRNYENI